MTKLLLVFCVFCSPKITRGSLFTTSMPAFTAFCFLVLKIISFFSDYITPFPFLFPNPHIMFSFKFMVSSFIHVCYNIYEYVYTCVFRNKIYSVCVILLVFGIVSVLFPREHYFSCSQHSLGACNSLCRVDT